MKCTWLSYPEDHAEETDSNAVTYRMTALDTTTHCSAFTWLVLLSYIDQHTIPHQCHAGIRRPTNYVIRRRDRKARLTCATTLRQVCLRVYYLAIQRSVWRDIKFAVSLFFCLFFFVRLRISQRRMVRSA